MKSQDDLQDRVLQRLDPTGQLSIFFKGFDTFFGRAALGYFGNLAGVDTSKLTSALDGARQLLEDSVSAIVLLAPLGWAPTERANVNLYRDALQIYRESESLDNVGQRLVDGWNANGQLRRAVMQLQVVGAGHPGLQSIARQRWSLVERALAHHEAGAFEASVPIVFAQIDGIIQDLEVPTPFFSKSGQGLEYLLDEVSLLGLPESLRPLRKLFGAEMRRSGVSGKLSRHGVLRGRELGYDTKENSTKVFVLLSAVVQWALPKGRERADIYQQEREARYAGSDKVDQFGRRLDRREFAQAKQELDYLTSFQYAEWNQNGRYGDCLESMNSDTEDDRLLQVRGKLHLRTNPDRTSYWAWRDTPSGFCLGVAGRNGAPVPWHFAGKGAPLGGPGEESRWRHVRDDPALPD